MSYGYDAIRKVNLFADGAQQSHPFDSAELTKVLKQLMLKPQTERYSIPVSKEAYEAWEKSLKAAWKTKWTDNPAEPKKGLMQLKPAGPFIRTHKKIGRNESCACGSGKKYKNCCLKKII